MNKPGRTYVLQQDEHLQNLRKIIKRDFFSSPNQQIKKQQHPIELSLNDYIKNFKSNENQVFSQLVESDKQKWKDEHWWFDKQDKLLMIEKEKLKQLKGQSKQYRNMIQSNKNQKDLKVALVGQEAKNSIFFNRDKNYGSYLNQDQQAKKKINYHNCKFQSKDQKERKRKIKEQNEQKKSSSQSQEYQNPMTWGQIQSTPLRISSQQSQYRIPERPQKDVLLDKLASKINKSKVQALQSQNRKSQLLMKIMGSSTPSYKINSSYVRSSSIRRADSKKNGGQTPLVHNKKEQSDMEGLLKFNSKS